MWKQTPFGCVNNTDTSFGGQNFISQSTPLTGGAGTQRHTRRAHSQVYLKGKVQQEYPSQTKKILLPITMFRVINEVRTLYKETSSTEFHFPFK